MSIKLLYKKYNWESYSVVRLLVEEFERQAELTDSFQADTVISLGQNAISSVHRHKIDRSRTKVVQVGLSDPNCHNENDAEYADLVFTNDMKKAAENFYIWLPCFTSAEYFYPMSSVKKEIDVLFVGLCHHPFTQNRLGAVNRLRAHGISVKVFGPDWPTHPDNQPFISGPALREAYCSAHICLDLCNSVTSMGSRIFQSANCGTPVLTRRRDDIVKLFGESVLYFEDFRSMHTEIMKNLGDKEKLKIIGGRALQYVMSQHQVSKRVTQILQEVRHAAS